MNWLALAVAVTLIDRRKPTLSGNFRRAARARPVPVTLATAFLVAHLYGFIPCRYDPLRRIG